MSGVDVMEGSLRAVPLRVEARGKPRVVAGDAVEMAIELGAHLARRIIGLGQRVQHGLQVGHENRRRDSLAADVGNGEDQPPIGQGQDVVVVAADSSGRHADSGKFKAAVHRELPREERLLHLKREV